MPNSIDNKIVEMQFDNANFEKNVKQSIKTLEQLNKALELDDAAKGFEQMEKAAESIDLSKLTKAAEVIEKRFSAAGIAGAAVINRAVNGVINGVSKLGSSIVSMAKSGGINRALNLEHANFMLEGLLKDSQKVAQIMNGPVNNAVSGTAYGLDAAANAAAQLVASGVTDMTKLETALTGVSGVAAMTSSSFEEISSIFTTVAGQGKVMTMQLRQIEARGLNAAAAIGTYLHKTEAEVRQMVKDGEVDFNTFAEAMNKAFGDQAKKANETFTGALSNVKAALSRIGAKIATPALEGLRKIFVSLIDVINQVNTLLSSEIITRIAKFIEHISTSVATIVKSKKSIDVIKGSISNLEKIFYRIIDAARIVKQAFKNIFPKSALTTMKDFNEVLSNLLDKMTLSGETAYDLQMTFQGLFAILDIMITLVSQVIDVFVPGFSKVANGADTVGEKILFVTGYIGFLLTEFDKWLKKNNLIKAAADILTGALGLLVGVLNELGSIFGVVGAVILGAVDFFVRIGEAIWDFIKAAYNLPIVQKIVGNVKKAIYNLGQIAIPVLGFIVEGFINLVDQLEKFSRGEYLTSGLEKLNDVLNNCYWGIQYVIDGIKSIFGIFNKNKDTSEKIESVAVSFEKLASSGESLGVTSGVVTHNVEIISNSFDTLESSSKELATTTTGTMVTLKDAGKIFALGFGASVISATINIGRAFNSFNGFTRNIKSTSKSIKIFFEQLQLNLRIKTLLSLATCIVVLAGALALLTLLDPVKLMAASVAMTILMVAMERVSKTLATTDSLAVKRFQTAAKGMLEFATALLVLAAAAKIMSSYVKDWGTFAASIGSLIVVMGAMAVAVIAIGNYQKNAIKGATTMIAFGAAVYLVMLALQKIQTLDLQAIENAIPLMLQIVSGMVAVGLAMSLTIGPFGGLSFLGVATGIALLFDALQHISSIDPKVLYQVEDLIDEISIAIQHIIWALVLLQAFKAAEIIASVVLKKMVGVTNIFKNMMVVAQEGIKYIGIATLILAIAGAIYLIGETIIRLSALKPQEIALGAFVTAVIAAGVTKICSYIVKMAAKVFVAEQAGRMIGEGVAGIGVGLLAIAAAISILADMDLLLFAEGLFKVAFIGLFLLAFMAALTDVNKAGEMAQVSIKSMTAVALMIGVMTAALAILALIPFEDLVTPIIILAGMMRSLYLVFTAMAKIGQISKTAVAGVLAMSVVFGTLGYVAYQLRTMAPVRLMGDFLALDGAVGLMALIMQALSNMTGTVNNAYIAMGVISGAFLALGATAWLIQSIPVDEMAAKFAVISAAIAVMGVIMYVLAELKSEVSIGIIALVGITAIFAAMSVCALMLNSVNWQTFLANVGVMSVALVAIGGIAIALGALAPLAGVGELMLLALAASMIGFAAAAVIFAEAVNLAGQGLTIISSALSVLITIDIFSIALQLVALSGSLLLMELHTAPLFVLGAALYFISPAMMFFGLAVNSMVSGLVSFTSIDLSGLTGQFILLSQAIEFVNQRFLEFAAFTVLAYALASAFTVLGSSLTVLGVGLGAIVLAIDAAVAGFTMFASVLEWIGNIIIKVTEAITNMVDSLNSLGVNTVEEIYKILIDYASDRLYDAGSQMMEFVAEGFSDNITNCIQNIITPDIVEGFDKEATRIYQDIYAAGYKLGEAYKMGLDDPIGAYCEAQASVDAVDDTRDGFVGESGRVEGDVNSAGQGVGSAYGSGLWNGIKGWLSGIGDRLKEFWNSLTTGSIFSGFSVGDITESVTSSMSKYTSNRYKSSQSSQSVLDRMGLSYAMKTGRVQYIPGVGYVYSDTGTVYHDFINSTNAETNAIDENTDSQLDNADASSASGSSKKSSTKATKDNTDATKDNTAAINEQADALDSASMSAEEYSQEIQELAEQIEVITDPFNTDLNWQGLKSKNKILKSLTASFGSFWSSVAADPTKINESFKAATNSLKGTVDYVAKGTYHFNSHDKIIKKLSTTTMLSSKQIKKEVEKTGRTVIKVFEGQMKVFTKNQNGIEKFTVAVPKATKNLAKFAKQAKAFANSLNGVNVDSIGDSTTLINNLRGIEKYFVSIKNMAKSAKSYLTQVYNAFDEAGFKNSMNILGKNIDGVGNIMSKNSKSTAYVEDAFVSLAATLYDGSEAANEYATQMARLEFLFEHGEATEEELAEARRSYISRITEALVEYKNTLTDTLTDQMDIWSEFNKNAIEGGAETLIKNIESQIAGYQNWGNMLIELSKRGVDSTVMKTLTDEGVESYGKLEAMLSMTREQLALFNQDFKTSQKMIEQTADTAIAAMANATNRASQRAAAQKGNKVAAAQLKKSKKTAKEMQDEYKAVAQAVLTTDKVTKKQEKDYLKTLTKSERKEYKKTKKDLKAAEAEEKRLAAIERARVAEENRVTSVYESIKSLETFISVMDQYSNDTNVMAKINEQLATSLGDVQKNVGTSADTMKKYLKFADQLGASGTTAEEYFQSVADKVAEFRDNLKSALYNMQDLFNEFSRASTTIKADDLFSNFISNLRASVDFGTNIQKMANMGYNSQMIQYISELYSSDRATALQYMKVFLTGTKEEIARWNNAFTTAKSAMEDALNKTDNAVVRSETDVEKEAYEAAKKRYESAQSAYNKAAEDVAKNSKVLNLDYFLFKYAKNDNLNYLQMSSSKSYSVSFLDNLKKSFKSLLNTLNTEVFDVIDESTGQVTQSKLSASQKVEVLKKYFGTYYKSYSNILEDYEQKKAAIQKKYAGDDGYIQYKINQLDAEMQRTYGSKYSASKYIYEEITALEKKGKAEEEAKQKALAAAKAQLAKYEAEYKSAQATWDAVQAERARLEALAKAEAQMEINYQTAVESVTTLEEWNNAVTANKNLNGVLYKALQKVNKALNPVITAITMAKDKFSQFNGTGTLVVTEVDQIEQGFLRLAETLSSSNEETDDFLSNMSTRLEEYRATLYDTIKGQVSLFDEFKKYSGDTATTADTYLDNMSSQINGLSEWLTNLETLASRGVSGSILQMFAEEGQGSFEKVAAFANATDAQLGELISQYEKYIALTDEAADRAMAAIGASYTDKAMEAADTLVEVFESTGYERVAESAYEAGATIISGVADGMGNEMPSLISSVAKTAEEVTSAIGSQVSSAAVANSVKSSLSKVDQAIAATLTMTLDSYYDEITAKAVEKFKMAVDSINEYAEENLNTEYTITVHVDTSEIDAAVARMNAAIYGANMLAGQAAGSIASSNANQQATFDSSQPVATNTNVTYNQTINSPTAMNQVEIYRESLAIANQIKNTIALSSG